MVSEPDIAAVAQAIGEPARAATLLRKDGVVDDMAPGSTGVVRTFDHPLLAALGVVELPGPGPAVRACLDWSHETVHLAGALGTALLTALLEKSWVRRRPGGRALRMTEAGRQRFGEFGIS